VLLSRKDKDKKKSASKPSRYGPQKGWSKAKCPSEKKKKNLKRKEPPSSHSTYDGEEDMPHISESEQEKGEEDVEHDVSYIGTSNIKVIRKKVR
jgi:hypothetical protein